MCFCVYFCNWYYIVSSILNAVHDSANNIDVQVHRVTVYNSLGLHARRLDVEEHTSRHKDPNVF